MNPLKQFLKLHRLELQARACVDRSSAMTLVSNKRIKKAGRALPASSESPAEQTGERNSQP